MPRLYLLCSFKCWRFKHRTNGRSFNRVDIRKHFYHPFTSGELEVTKPNLEFFTEILKNLKLTPEECIMVGNDYEKDIIPAKSVGLHTILFAKDNNRSVFNDADYSINSMYKLYEIIKNFDGFNKTID